MRRKEVPRLSIALKAAASQKKGQEYRRIVTAADDPVYANLLKKRKQRENTRQKEKFTWKDFIQAIKRSKPIDEEKVTKLAAAVKSLAVELSGGNESVMADEAAVFLLQRFHSTQVASVADWEALKRAFGNVDLQVSRDACSAVKNLLEALPEDFYENFVAENSNIGVKLLEEPFGKSLDISLPSALEKALGTDSLKKLVNILRQNEEPSGPAAFDTTSFSMLLPANQRQWDSSSLAASSVKKSKWNKRWLESMLKTSKCGQAGDQAVLADLMNSVLSILSSKKSDDEIQNELFDLLGFDFFEVIQEMLEHRQDLVDSTKVAFDKAAVDAIKAVAPINNNRPASVYERNRMPTYGCQVTVQSQAEKEQLKLIQKEEKKRRRKDGPMDVEEPSGELLKEIREQELDAIRAQPLLRQPDKPRYPNVYDSFQEVRQSAGYIGGMKILLPEGTERINEKAWEEVRIPINSPTPTGIRTRKLIQINELDDICKIGFRGMKSLNLIQSIVYETAYKKSENMLICAPTGAGKTNVALLTVLSLVRLHSTSTGKGQVHVNKEQFKIVYVAPMKALAAEMVATFSKKLEPFKMLVRELTGDMQLTKSEIMETSMIVTTPEKWDVVTRKPGDSTLISAVKLLIIDEVHLLHGDRGPVVEALVARTKRQVEAAQIPIRIVGLSATLPNYVDVARFLWVNPETGLFFFDSRFRPVPLGMTFIGVKALNMMQQAQEMDAACYEKVWHFVQKGQQVMVFVHARNATVRTATILRDMAQSKGHSEMFMAEQSGAFGNAQKALQRSKNKQLRELFDYGFSMHHAGMLRADRSMVERFFADGMIKVLCCTSTLAWGVNLPAHAVVIKGTEIYDAKHGSYVDLSILDVMQIFGRAGRPQFDTSGHGVIITTHDKLAHFLSLLTRQFPIESSFVNSLADNLNAEISLGTVTNLREAVEWLSYTYLYVRMRKNPMNYGIKYEDAYNDPNLVVEREKLIRVAAMALDKAKMIRFDDALGFTNSTDTGRTASTFYVKYDTIETFNELLKPFLNEAQILSAISKAQEFEQIKVRDEELDELDRCKLDACWLPVAGGSENSYGKVNILMQCHISRYRLEAFSLVSDQAYVIQNATRIARGLFEIILHKNWPTLTSRALNFCKVLERQQWGFEHPLRQMGGILPFEILEKIEKSKVELQSLREMDLQAIGNLIHHQRAAKDVKTAAWYIPQLELEANVQPITRTVLRVRVVITPDFTWSDRVHGKSGEPFWLWVEDPENNHMYHHEQFMVMKRNVLRKDPIDLVFTIPIFEPMPPQYIIRCVSDRWLGAEFVTPISFLKLILPERHPPHTELLDLTPLPKTVLKDKDFESLYKFSHFNPIQTQLFHTLYHTDGNVLLGAPTGSGKTIVAEVAMFRVFKNYPGAKVVYIAPMKALVRERIIDWEVRLTQKLGRKVVELTGDVTPDARAIQNADVIVTTPEKWDGISRSWQNRQYVQAVALIVIDEIHLLGEDRGPVLEVIVSRTSFIASHTQKKLRIIGLSTALANAQDLADWLGIADGPGLYNFRPSVRPVPLEVHIQGFSGKHYCPRMMTMNKPTFQAIQSHSPTQPTLVFVSSRRQTRLTAMDLITFLAAESNPRQWLRCDERAMDEVLQNIKDPNLKVTLSFGVGIHHAGLHERDRKIVEEMFVSQKIQVLVATATLAWGVNFPAHLVVIKGTEYYDGKTKRYVDFPITDVLQMMGRAGRPQYDNEGVAVVMVHDLKKAFYKKFLYEPFPVESSLLNVLPDHLNAEVVAGTINSKQDALDYLTWTFFFRRLMQNPGYYGLETLEPVDVNKYLSGLVDKSVKALEASGCLELDDDGRMLHSTVAGRVASFYYLSHETLALFQERLKVDSTLEDVLKLLCDAHEYSELPVRHNEDLLNADLAKSCPIKLDNASMDSPHTKAHLLFQARFSRLALPNSEYETDLKSVLDQAIRIMQAMLDMASEKGLLSGTLLIQNLLQMVIQARWLKDSSLSILPKVEMTTLPCFCMVKGVPEPITTLPQLLMVCSADNSYEKVAAGLRNDTSLEEGDIEEIYSAARALPLIQLDSVEFLAASGPGSGEAVRVDVPVNERNPSKFRWSTLSGGREYAMKVKLVRATSLEARNSFNGPQRGRGNRGRGRGAGTGGLKALSEPQRGGRRQRNTLAITPHWGKAKDEGWFLVLGNIETKELLAIKRIGYVGASATQMLTFVTPNTTGRTLLTLYLMSDSYIGLDQQFDIPLELEPSPDFDDRGDLQDDFDDYYEVEKFPTLDEVNFPAVGASRDDREGAAVDDEEFWLNFGS